MKYTATTTANGTASHRAWFLVRRSLFIDYFIFLWWNVGEKRVLMQMFMERGRNVIKLLLWLQSSMHAHRQSNSLYFLLSFSCEEIHIKISQPNKHKHTSFRGVENRCSEQCCENMKSCKESLKSKWMNPIRSLVKILKLIDVNVNNKLLNASSCPMMIMQF